MTYIFGLVVVLICILIGAGVWANRAKPEKRILDKYNKKTFVSSTLPFSNSWQAQVHESDVERFLAYRKRMLILYVLNFIVFSVFAIISLNFEYFYKG